MKEVLIIESRNPSDHYHNRREGNILSKVLGLGGVKTICLEVLNKSFFVEAIRNAADESIKYVHFSGHGYKDGFELTNGDIITWEILDEIAWPILKNKCLVFSSCNVAKGVEKLFDIHKTFCNVIIAPTRKLGWDEGLVAYSTFYHKAKNTETSTEADVRVMNHITGRGTFKLFSPKNKPIDPIG